jgi:hypothetical protein
MRGRVPDAAQRERHDVTPRAATSPADRTHVRRRNWAGEPILLLGEDARGYDDLLAQVSRALVPHDVIEDMWIRDVVDLAAIKCLATLDVMRATRAHCGSPRRGRSLLHAPPRPQGPEKES